MTKNGPVLRAALDDACHRLERGLTGQPTELQIRDVGSIASVAHGIAQVEGLVGVRAQEVLHFPHNKLGLAFNIDPGAIGTVLLDDDDSLRAGAEVTRTNRVLDTPVGESLLGRVVDALGRPLDQAGPLHAQHRLPVEREAPPILDRAPVRVPLQTGLKVVDALIPIGRGQRELILGDRQTGKTAIVLDTILNQRETGVLCIYCAIGQRRAAVAKVIANLRQYGAFGYTTVVVSTGEEPPGLQFVAPYTAMSMAEYFAEHGRDVLVAFDDLTHHARAYRELSLLLRRPPGREAYPGDVFYIHARLLERSTHLRENRGGGSVTALPVIETQAQNLAAYIPTNLISITDGQIYLSPELFQRGVLPAVDVGKSVSRVGGRAQLAAYRALAGQLRLSYAQFAELESFARFGTRLDEETRKTIEHGRRVREILQQPQYAPVAVPEQIAVLAAVLDGVFADMALDSIAAIEPAVRRAIIQLPELCERILGGELLTADDSARLLDLVWTAKREVTREPSGGVG